jgi:hypothetical protein
LRFTVVTDHRECPVLVILLKEAEAKILAQQLQMLHNRLLVTKTDNVELSTSVGVVLTSALAKPTEQVIPARWKGRTLIGWWTFVAMINPVDHPEKEIGRYPGCSTVAVTHFLNVS